MANAAATPLALRPYLTNGSPRRQAATPAIRTGNTQKDRAANDLHTCRDGDGGDASEEVGDGLAGQAAGHEHQPGAAVGIGPVL